ncbi:hypothetical protein GE061_016432 [Apolygus lucorum]|uniref:Uncharacterized protein n=1 Tax=Apolygus lucorum TaxID=248454 RepID=A0A6A4K2L9_APOLU|nr:hypothetical protein GE061_016432 [Apolygus lucorum]
MWTLFFLVVLSSIADDCLSADATEECQILQTTDPRTPCYILIRQGVQVPPFIYMLNIPRPTPELPCPASQTLDSKLTCYIPNNEPDAPAFVLNAPLLPNSDELDESPSGKLALREAKANPLFKPIKTEETKFRHQTSVTGPQRSLGPPSPHLTMAVFRPLNPSPSFTEAPMFRTQSHHDFSTGFPSPKTYQLKYRIIHYTSPLRKQPFYQGREQSSGSNYPYPAGSSSFTTFQGPYPPSTWTTF